MSKKVSDFLLECLAKWGVSRIFGYPGDGINGAFSMIKQSFKQM
jgi:pyruvate dehydrogenase (quinone)